METVKKDLKYRMQRILNNNSQKLIIFAVLIALYVFFAIFGKNFATNNTLVSIFNRSYYVAFGHRCHVCHHHRRNRPVLRRGHGIQCTDCRFFFEKVGAPLWLVLVIMVLAGLLYGTFNGILVAYLKLPPFIATLGTMLISIALGSIACNVNTISFPTRFDPNGQAGISRFS